MRRGHHTFQAATEEIFWGDAQKWLVGLGVPQYGQAPYRTFANAVRPSSF